MCNTYFEVGMNPTAASLYHLEKTNFQEDLFGTANHSINPSLRTIQYLKDVWLKDHGGGFDNMTMLNMLNKYEQNPELTIKSDVTADGVFCVALITPFMRRVHEHMKEAGGIVFVDSISNSADQLNIAVTPILCASPSGALPLAMLFHSSQEEEMYTKGFGMVNDAIGEAAFFHQGSPKVIMTDNADALTNALKNTWPTAQLFVCHFHILQQGVSASCDGFPCVTSIKDVLKEDCYKMWPGSNKKTKYKYADEMSFVMPSLLEREAVSNLATYGASVDTEDVEDEEEDDMELQPKKHKCSSGEDQPSIGEMCSGQVGKCAIKTTVCTSLRKSMPPPQTASAMLMKY